MNAAAGPGSGAYPIVEVEDAWATKNEAMGSKPKFWYRIPGEEARWLFKYPQGDSGQHWAEKIAAEVAACLDIPHAVVELAEYRGSRGSASKSFAVRGQFLVHGNEVLAVTMPYDPEKRFGQSAHTVDNIFRALEKSFEDETAAEIARREFAGYLVLDALIGNTDRHHENWGLLVERTPTSLRGRLAPTFDHASSLGRELRDEKREARLQNRVVGRYAEKARGGIYWRDRGRYGPSPLELVRLCACAHPELFQEPIARVRERRDRFEEAVRRVPDRWMSEPARAFALALMEYNSEQLEQCLK